MKIIKGIEIPLTICVSYTIISLGAALFELLFGINTTTHTNSLLMFIWTCIAVLTLSIHYLFDNWPPILMILVQYIIAMGLVLLSVLIFSFITHDHVTEYLSIFLSFSIPYAIGATCFYISVFTYAKKQNQLLEQIQKTSKKS